MHIISLLFLLMDLAVPMLLVLLVNALSAGVALYRIACQVLYVASFLAFAVSVVIREVVPKWKGVLAMSMPRLRISLALGLVDLVRQCISEYATSTIISIWKHLSAVYAVITNPTVRTLALAVVEVVIAVLEDLYAFYVNFGIIAITTSVSLDRVLASCSTMKVQRPKLEESTGKSYRDVEAKALALLREQPTLVRPEVFCKELNAPTTLALSPLASPAATTTLNPLALAFTPGPVKPKVAEADKSGLSFNPTARPFVPQAFASPAQAKAMLNPLAAEFKPLVSVKSSLSATVTAFVPTFRPAPAVQPEAPTAHVPLKASSPVFVPKALLLQSSNAALDAKPGLNALAPVFVPRLPRLETAPAASSKLNANAPSFVPATAPGSNLSPEAKAFSPASENTTTSLLVPAPPANLSASPTLNPRFETSHQSFNLFPLPTTLPTLSHSVSFYDRVLALSPTLSASPSCPAYTNGSWESDESGSDSEGSSFTLVDWDENSADKEASLTWDASYAASKGEPVLRVLSTVIF